MSFNIYHIRTDDFSAHAGGGQGAVITRDNYEAYFVMYVDDELNATERKAVEQFLEQNRDLEEEMVMLQQSVLRADDHVVFEQKELLFKGDEHTSINEQNCEEYFVRYGDDELTNAEKEKVEQFVYHHPQYQADFELIQQVKLAPDNNLSFPDKSYLYRTEDDDNRVIAFPWWRLTAAAITIIAVGTLVWNIGTKTGNGNDMVNRTPSTKSTNGNNTKPEVISPNNIEPDKQTKDNGVTVNEIPAPVNTITGDKQPDNIIVAASHKKNISKPSNKQLPLNVKQESIPTPEQDPEITDIAIASRPVEIAVDNSYKTPAVKGIKITGTVAQQVPVHTVAYKTNDEPDQSSTYVLNAPINKTPLRGFFRKVSRVVEKVTTTEEGKKGVRIANLEIALN
jgi:hypothetical protein